MLPTLPKSKPVPPSSILLGDSEQARKLRLQVTRFAPHFRTVLLIGEKGAGKTQMAECLHLGSPACADAFVAMTLQHFASATLPDVGTLFLSGLESTSIEHQDAALSRLQLLPKAMRIAVSCRCEPRGLLASGRLRPELFDRIGMLELRVPPLRDRRGDLPLLASALLQGEQPSLSWDDQDLEALCRHDWPGNLPELADACALFAQDGCWRAESAPVPPLPPLIRLEEVVERHVLDVLEHCAGNKLRAAELLGISRSTLYRMLGTTA